MTASIIGGRSRPHRRNPRTTGQRTRPAAPTSIAVVAATYGDDLLTVTFDQPVMLSGTPAYQLGTARPVSARRVTPSSVRLAYPPGTSAGPLAVAADDPAVTNSMGGRVNGGTVAVTPATEAQASESAPALRAA